MFDPGPDDPDRDRSDDDRERNGPGADPDVTGGLANAAAGINQFVAESLMVALAVIV